MHLALPSVQSQTSSSEELALHVSGSAACEIGTDLLGDLQTCACFYTQEVSVYNGAALYWNSG